MVQDKNSTAQREHEVVFSDQKTIWAASDKSEEDFQSQLDQIELGGDMLLTIPNREAKEDAVLLRWLMSGYKPE